MSDVVALFVVLLIFYSIAAVRPQTFPSSVAGLLLGRALPLLRLRELLASAAGLTGRACAVDLPHGDVAGREGGAARAGRPGGGRVRRRRWRSDGQRRHHIIVESSRLSARGAAGGCCRALLRPAAQWGGGGRAGEPVRRPRVAPRRQNERRLVSEMARRASCGRSSFVSPGRGDAALLQNARKGKRAPSPQVDCRGPATLGIWLGVRGVATRTGISGGEGPHS
eukprot:COSAG04_NODE_303_length_17328_cov_9.758937_11_plen_224_part_00